MEIYIRGSVSSGKTLLAESLRKRAESCGRSVFVSDHKLHEWKESFPEQMTEDVLAFKDSGCDVGIFCINTGADRAAPVVSFSKFIGLDSFILS